jgi:hypothetical protein
MTIFFSEIKFSGERVYRREFRVIDQGLVVENIILENGDLLRHQIWSRLADNYAEAVTIDAALECQDWHVKIQDGEHNDAGQRVTHFDPSHFLVRSVNWNRGFCYIEHFRPAPLEVLSSGDGINVILNRYKLLDTLENKGKDPNAALTKDFLIFRSPFRFDEDVNSSINNRSRF